MGSRIRTALAASCVIAAAFAATASANVQVGTSSWQWGNPLPQGNDLRDMAFAGTTGYAVGDFGTVVKTTDAGATWTGLPSGTFTNLGRVQIAADGAVFAGGGCVLRVSRDGGATFQRVPFLPSEASCAQPLATFAFQSAGAGYIVLANGTVLHTLDGGVSFLSAATGIPGTPASPTTPGSARPTDIWFMADGMTGFAATSSGALYATNDGAQTWHVVIGGGAQINRLLFVSPTTGFAVGAGGLFLTTIDAGLTWTPAATGTAANLPQLACASATVCLASTTGGFVLRTIDGGHTFTQVIPPVAVGALGFASPTQVVTVGTAGATAVSADGGANYTTVGGRLPGTYTRLRAGGQANTAYAVGANGALASTTDGGHTWHVGKVQTPGAVTDASFPDASHGWALDSDGALYKTANAGLSWSPIDTGSTQRASAIYAPKPNDVFVFGPRGIRHSSDAGATFKSDPTINRIPLTNVDRAGSGAIIAYGPTFVLESTNDGKSWTSLHKPGTYKKVGSRKVNNLPITTVDFATASTGYLLDANEHLWKTTNTGKTWTELVSTGTSDLDGMAWSSATKGYLVATRFGTQLGPGFLYRTTDGGKTFHPQFVVSHPINPAGVAAPGGGADYVLDRLSNLLSTSTGGDVGATSTLKISAAPKRLTKSGPVVISGTLSPAAGFEQVVVSARYAHSNLWTHQVVQAKAGGKFTAAFQRVPKGTTQFVAQWLGDFRSAGAGTAALSYVVGPTHR